MADPGMGRRPPLSAWSNVFRPSMPRTGFRGQVARASDLPALGVTVNKLLALWLFNGRCARLKNAVIVSAKSPPPVQKTWIHQWGCSYASWESAFKETYRTRRGLLLISPVNLLTSISVSFDAFFRLYITIIIFEMAKIDWNDCKDRCIGI